ncbi:MAG: hypothetical protein ISS01_00480 [Nanoarchaeota archaeon]|nr:hypothetical protein [Nanoarchaeota archaeon]
MVKEVNIYEVCIASKDRPEIHMEGTYAAIDPYDALDLFVQHIKDEQKAGHTRREISRGYEGLIIEISAPTRINITPGLLEKLVR